MGQEIDTIRFSTQDFKDYRTRLREETALLSHWVAEGNFSERGAVAGFELEAWLVDKSPPGSR